LALFAFSLPNIRLAQAELAGGTLTESGTSIQRGLRTPQIWAGGGWWGCRRGLWGALDGSWNIIISYHVQEVCSKVVTF